MTLIRILPLLAFAVCLPAQDVGDVLPRWSPGQLDIHQINTGRGDSALLVFPDGTSLLVDAGDGGWAGPPRGVEPKPDDSRPAGEWIARYARRVLPAGENQAIDYGYLTHFHSDHMGGFDDVFEHLPIRTMLDRGWPNYDYPAPLEGDAFNSYRAFVEKAVEDGKLRAERFRPGRNDQIVLKHDPESYPEFEARNIAANGEVWTGVASNTRRHFPDNYKALAERDQPNENQCSMAVRISYGAFDYYTGGDMPGIAAAGAPRWHDVETPVAKAVGPVEVVVPNHHGNKDATNAFFVAALRPRLWILPVWSSDHPGHYVLERMYSTRLYPDERDVLATNMPIVNKQVIGPLLDRLLSDQGHIAIRVSPGGAIYRVFILEDGDESMRIKAVHGPYRSR